MRVRIFFVPIFFILWSSCKGQSLFSPLAIGDKVPLHIWESIPKKSSTKLIILDFWSTYCSNCIAAFPKMEELQNEFPTELQIVLINSSESKDKIKERFDKINKYRVEDKIQIPILLPSISGDTRYKKLFPHKSVPHHVWVNSNREVIYITSGYNATSKNIRSAIEGKKLNLGIKNDAEEKELSKYGYVRPSVQEMPAIYYSAFIPFFNTRSITSFNTDSVKKIFRITYPNQSALQFFETAFQEDGKQQPILFELKSRQAFFKPQDSTLIDKWRENNLFTYEAQIPLDLKDKWKEKMQLDANFFFGSMFQIEALREKRVFYSLILVRTNNSGLNSTGSRRISTVSDTSSTWTNQNFKYVVSYLKNHFENMEVGRPFLDETNFTGNVDLKLFGNLKEIENVRMQLKQYGLDIIEANREVEVLVIKDRKQNMK